MSRRDVRQGRLSARRDARASPTWLVPGSGRHGPAVPISLANAGELEGLVDEPSNHASLSPLKEAQPWSPCYALQAMPKNRRRPGWPSQPPFPPRRLVQAPFFLLSYGCAGQKTQAIGSIGARPHHLKATASGLDGWWSRWLLDWPTGRRRFPSVRHPSGRRTDWTASSRSDRTPHFCFSRKPEARLTVAAVVCGLGSHRRRPATVRSTSTHDQRNSRATPPGPRIVWALTEVRASSRDAAGLRARKG